MLALNILNQTLLTLLNLQFMKTLFYVGAALLIIQLTTNRDESSKGCPKALASSTHDRDLEEISDS